MIIKSMSRKTASFGQLISYIEREKNQGPYRIRYNVLGRDPERIRREFEANADLLKKRKNGTYLFHEIISITRAEGLSEEEHKIKLQQIAEAYVAARCPDNMVFGGLHADKEHSYHYHLMISSNAVGEEKRLRLSKAQFRDIQVRAEQDVLKNYPELKQELAIGKTASEKRNDRAHHVLKRGDKLTKREAIRDRVYAAWSQSDNRESLIVALKDQGFTLNLKKSLSVTDEITGKHHRIKTLDPDLFEMVKHTLGIENVAGEKEKLNRKEEGHQAEPQSAALEPEAEKQEDQKQDSADAENLVRTGKAEKAASTEEPSDFVRDVENIYERKHAKKAEQDAEKKYKKAKRKL